MFNLARTGRHIVQGIADSWSLTPEEQARLLGVESLPETLDRETQVRISHLLRIQLALRSIFPADRVHGWPRQPNEAFGGMSALDYMMQGRVEHLAKVDHYLRTVASGAF